MDSHAVAATLEEILEVWRSQLLTIGEDAAAANPGPDHWSKKEILGHLIDSASNNHQRFVRLQQTELLEIPAYQQNDWVRIQDYAGRRWSDLVDLWLDYNRHLAHIMRRVDPNALGHIWRTPSKDYTLTFLLSDYLTHMRHHLDQIAGGSAGA